ncbi:MAG: anti-sigma F factor antagonist [Clostridiales bacterium]|nr:anti-sigma F factor antagonist [Clostridiales bacterium]
MKVSFETIDNILIAQLEGELDHHTAKEVRDEVDKTIDAFFIKHLLFDFNKVTFMDSSGIGVIIGRYNKIHDMNGRVGVVNCNKYVDKIFEVSGLYSIIEKFSNLNEAIKSINE